MSAPPSAPDAPAPVFDRAVARAERRVARLERLAEKAMAMAEAVEEDGAKESAETFAKLSRAVRLTTTLEAKLDDALLARLAGVLAPAERAPTDPGARYASDPADPTRR